MHVRDVPTSVITKISKLLRLAARKHGPEAKTAQAMADKLMDKWGIEVDAAEEVGDTDTKIMFVVSKECVPWRHTLAEAIGRLYDCTATSTMDAEGGKRHTIHFFGKATDLLSMRLHYRHIEAEIERLMIGVYPVTSRHVVALGAARHVSYRIDEFLKPSRAPMPPPGRIPHNQEEKLEMILLPEEKKDALMKVPRVRVRPQAPEPSGASLREPVDLELDLPMRLQKRGVELASNSTTIVRYSAVAHTSLELPLNSAGFSKKITAILRDLNFRYVGELVEMTKTQLQGIVGLGVYEVAMLETELSYKGLRLRPESPFAKGVD